MAVYIITGKLGGGKTLCSVGLIRDALQSGRSVATNINLNLENLLSWKRRNVRCFRLPDKLSAESFEMIGSGNDSYEEENNGLVVLDEGGLSMNSRDYREDGRKQFIQWAIHSRKSGWDMAIIIQHIDGLDKQIRDFFGEHVVTCSRLDRVRIPFIGWVLQILGFKAMLPKMHKATCRYGQGTSSVVTWRKWFKGADLYDGFDTRQKYDPFDNSGVCSMLSPWHVRGRYSIPHEELKEYLIQLWERYFNVKLGRVFVFFCAACLGGWTYASFIEKPPGEVVQVAAANQNVSKVATTDQVKVEIPVDPWEKVYISSYLANIRTGEHKYWFRDFEGNSLKPENGWNIKPIAACKAIVRSPARNYVITCDRPKAQPAELVPGAAP